jgi:DNA-binding response OmpR family regulator
MANLPNKSNYLIERPKISAENAINNEENNKIFIIEEDEAMTLLLKTILDLQGYNVRTMHNIDEIEEIPPAMIIIDAGSAGTLKGLELCKEIRNNCLFDRTKIVVTSVLHDKELILNAGADLYIPKPYEISSLIRWVEETMRDTLSN